MPTTDLTTNWFRYDSSKNTSKNPAGPFEDGGVSINAFNVYKTKPALKSEYIRMAAEYKLVK